MTVEERLREALTRWMQLMGLSDHLPLDNVQELEWLKAELAARDLAVCEKVNTLDDAPGSELPKPSELGPQTLEATPYVLDRERAIARALVEADNQSIPDGYADGHDQQWMSDWALFVARAIIAADPWTQEYVSLKLRHTWNQVHLAEAADVIAELRAEVERLRGALNRWLEETEFSDGEGGIIDGLRKMTRQALTEKRDG